MPRPRDCVIILKPSFVMRRPNKKVRYLRQSATVTAFGHSVYDRLIANIAIIHSMFRRAVGECFTEDCVNSTFEEWPAIDAGNRYFTPKAVACSENVRSIGIDIDPFGSLNKAASSLFVHTEDNKVYYFRRRESANGESLWVTWTWCIHLNILDWHVTGLNLSNRSWSKMVISSKCRFRSLPCRREITSTESAQYWEVSAFSMVSSAR